MPAVALALHLPVPSLPTSTSSLFHASASLTVPSIATVQPTNIHLPALADAKDEITDLLAPYLAEELNFPSLTCKTNLDICLVDVTALRNDTMQNTPLADRLTERCNQDFRSCVRLEPGPVVDTPLPQDGGSEFQERSLESALEDEHSPVVSAVLQVENMVVNFFSGPGPVLPASAPASAPDAAAKTQASAIDAGAPPGPVLPVPGPGLEGRELERVPDAIYNAHHILTKRAKPTSSTLDVAALSGASFSIATAAPERAPTPDNEAQAGASFNVGAEEVANPPPK